MERSEVWCSRAHSCMLWLTFALLLCEIVVGRVCKSLINMVDSFHTLSVLVRIILHPSVIPARASVTSTPDPYIHPASQERAPQHLTPAAHVRVPDSHAVPSPHAAEAAAAATGAAPAAPERALYSALRVRPFGALVSALLLACLCISFLFEILSHTLQPHPIRRPLLATVVGAASLLFNGLMLVWRRGSETNAGFDGSSKSLTGIQHRHFNTTKNKEPPGSILMFCNPEASSLDPGQACQESSSSSSICTDPTTHTTDPRHRFRHGENFISHDSTGCQQPQQTLQLKGPLTEVANNNACVHTALSVSPRSPASGRCNQESHRTGHQWQFVIQDCVTVIQSLLASSLVLLNGLVPLILDPACLPPRWSCRLLLYLDPGFSALTVLVLLTGALPELRRHGLVLLQACPPHVRVREVAVRVSRVPGVLAVHELHVWQLTEGQAVASVHVHCPSGLGVEEYSAILTSVTEELSGFGLGRCTVQLELLEPVADLEGHPPCSLCCGTGCAKMMCCSPPQERCCSTTPPCMDMEETHQEVVIESMYL